MKLTLEIPDSFIPKIKKRATRDGISERLALVLLIQEGLAAEILTDRLAESPIDEPTAA